MASDLTQVVLTGDGRFARIIFRQTTPGKIRIKNVSISENEDAEDSEWVPAKAGDFDKDQLREMIAQLDLSELELDF